MIYIGKIRMKIQLIKKIALSLVLSAGISYSASSSAHIYSGFIINKTTQVLTLICPAGTAALAAQVLDGTSNAGIMSVTVFKDGNARVSSDLVQGEGIYSSFATLAAGAGTYYLIASQTAVASGTYKIQYHCEDAGGSETTNQSAVLTQN